MDSDEIESNERPLKRRRLSSDRNGANGTEGRESSVHTTSADKIEDEQQAKDWGLGIRSYVDSDPVPLSGSLKTRYTDFLVNEILLDGTVLHLETTKPRRQKGNNSREVPVRAEPDAEVKAASLEHGLNQQKLNERTQNVEAKSDAISSAEREQLVEYLNETAAAEIIELYQSINAHPDRKSRDHPTVRTEFTTDRSLRGKIHQFIRKTFHSKIDSSTDHDGVLVLTAATTKSRRDNQNGLEKAQRFGKLGWAERGGEYVHFTLYKENKDTMEAISYLARQLKCNAKAFQFAGTKDRRAVTTQRCSAYRVEAERLAAQNGSFRNSKVGDFEYHPHGLELGDLKGNEFVVTLRDASISASGDRRIDLRDLDERMDSLHKNGFINYYGHQRFGTFSMRTDVIGGHILRENFKAACDAILHFSESLVSTSQSDVSNNEDKSISRVNQDDLSRARAISQWQSTNSAQKALDLLPRKFSAEAQLIRHLSRHANDYFGALMLIQRNLRLMYVHAYQSYIWNFAASNRIALYGTQVVPGDLVLVNEHKDKELHNGQTTTSTRQYPNTEGSTSISATTATDADGDPILEPAGTDRTKNADDAFERARVLTAADIAAHNY